MATFQLMKTESGYRFYTTMIAGYEFSVMQTPDNYFSFGAPFGDTPEDKAMFDDLVYYNKSLYHGRDWFGVRENIKNFIKKYKTKTS